MEGKILALNCGMYSVLSDGAIYCVPARGLFRHESIKPMVGDDVEIDEVNLVIQAVYPRHSQLKRPQVANIDQMLIVSSLVEPSFSFLLIFKYLTYANMNGIKASIIITKADKNDDQNLIDGIKETFQKMNIDTYFVSNKEKIGLEEVRHLFANRITCLIGQTGVGKSSLINAIDPQFERAVGEYSRALGRGKHKTKEVILLPYEGGYIADTPGFSSLELNLFKEELAKYFPGFADRSLKCYFSNCLHISEERCEVKKALEDGIIPKVAYDCYLTLSNEAIFEIRRYEK
ncbi:MAG TPA: ribosome small subunit-dependent GTPase A [Bacilli bacterium]|nr:ribosome small subunit-dependent GTPase A [Bacilli bacterium]HPS19044.1 ribosome small subunit-dependent GTPase A [Bacilli bacterium]